MDKRRKKVAVIGAGLGGLASGCFLAMNGYDVEIFENAAAPGGVARTRHDDAHKIEGGLAWTLCCNEGMSTRALYESLGLTDLPGMETVSHYLRVVDLRTKTRFDFTSDLDDVERRLKALAPNDIELIDDLMKGARGFSKFDAGRAGFDKAPELVGLWDKIALGWRALPVMSVFTNKTYLETRLDEWVRGFESEAARNALTALFPLTEVAPWFIMMMLGFLAQGQVVRFKRGSDGFIDAIVARFNGLGGKITCNARVTTILVEEGAVGVQLADGSEHRADAVVSTGATETCMNELLGGAYTDESTQQRLDLWKRTPPATFVHFVLTGELDDESTFQEVLLPEPVSLAGCDIQRLSLRFVGDQRILQASFDSSYAYFAGVSAERAHARRHETVHDVTLLLERVFPGFATKVASSEIVTSDQLAPYVLAPRGVTGAWAPAPKAIMAPMLRTMSTVSRLYFAGQWALAGAGVMAVLYSGEHAAQLVCHDDGVAFAMKKPGE